MIRADLYPMRRAPGHFRKDSRSYRSPFLVVVVPAMRPKIVFIRDAILDQLVRTRVVALPLALDRPSTIVRNLEAGITAAGTKGRSPLASRQVLLNYVINRIRERALSFFGFHGCGGNHQLIIGGDRVGNAVSEKVKPAVFVEFLMGSSNLRLCLGFFHNVGLDRKIVLFDQAINGVASYLGVCARMEIIAKGRLVPS